jgi:hypothetical protein
MENIMEKSNVAVLPQAQAPITPMQMLQTAVERGTDIDQLTKLMDLQERWEKNEARKAFVSALNDFKADPPAIEKNKHVSFGGGRGSTAYDHATLDHVCDVIGKALSRHGLSHRWEVEQDERGAIRVACVITHALGHSERVSMSATADTSGSKNSIQAIGSTVTYLQRYTLLAATGLAAKGQDDDAKTGEAITQGQADELETYAEGVGADKKSFLKYMGVESFVEIPESKYQEAMNALRKKGEKK